MLLGQCIRSDKTRKRGCGNHCPDSIARATQGAKLHKGTKPQHLLTQKHFLGAHRKDRLCLFVRGSIPQLHDQSQSALIRRAKRNRDERAGRDNLCQLLGNHIVVYTVNRERIVE